MKASAAPPSFAMVADGAPNCVAAGVRTPASSSVVHVALVIDGSIVQAFCACAIDHGISSAAVESSAQT